MQLKIKYLQIKKLASEMHTSIIQFKLIYFVLTKEIHEKLNTNDSFYTPIHYLFCI